MPVVYLLWMVQQPELVPRTIDPTTLYAMTIPGVVIELEKDRGIRALDGTALELDRTDLTRIITGSFSEQDVIRKAEAIVHTIGTTMDQAPPDTFQFYINIKTERPVVQQYLKDYFRHNWPPGRNAPWEGHRPGLDGTAETLRQTDQRGGAAPPAAPLPRTPGDPGCHHEGGLGPAGPE
jgi:hypothetical protein